MFRRPCLVSSCPLLSLPGRSRCADHERERSRHKRAVRARAETGARDRHRAGLNRAGAGTCASCGVTFPAFRLEVDHVVPLWEGGLDVEENLQNLCRPCHRGKTAEEARRRAARKFGA